VKLVEKGEKNMARFDEFTEEEMQEICTGLFHGMAFDHQELAIEASTAYNAKIKKRLDTLPHCKTCNQLMPRERNED